MVAPVVLKNWPTVTFSDAYGFNRRWETRQGYTQARPIDRVLVYSSTRATASCSDSSKDNANGASSIVYSNASTATVANNSYNKLKSKLYDTAGLGVDLVEYHQSLSMMVNRFTQLRKAAGQIRHLDFLGAAHTISRGVVPKGVSARKSFANNWLEYHFGWSPLLGDIHDAAEVLSNPIKDVRASASSSDIQFWSKHTDAYSYTEDDSYMYKVRVTQGCLCAVTNPNLHLADQMGLINPLSLAWEVVPFSFVVDWFVNVGDYLGSLSDFAGLSVKMPYCSTKIVASRTWTKKTKPPPAGPTPGYTVNSYGFGTNFVRNTSLSGVSLAAKPLKLPSASRAATAVSLLIQQLSR